MKHQLFHRLIATTTIFSITVSIPNIALAGNHQPQTLTLEELSCIQDHAKHDKDPELVKLDINDKLDKSIILEKLAKLNKHSVVYKCLNDDLQSFMKIQIKYHPQEVAFSKIEPTRQLDNYAFTSELSTVLPNASTSEHSTPRRYAFTSGLSNALHRQTDKFQDGIHKVQNEIHLLKVDVTDKNFLNELYTASQKNRNPLFVGSWFNPSPEPQGASIMFVP